MTTQGDTIGIMDPAFFVSKSEILSWLNTLLSVNITMPYPTTVERAESRVMRDRCSVLSDHRCHLPRHSVAFQSELAGQT